MWSLLTQLDTLDLAIFTALAAAAVYFLYNKFFGQTTPTYTPNIVPVQTGAKLGRSLSSDDPSFVNRMKNGVLVSALLTAVEWSIVDFHFRADR